MAAAKKVKVQLTHNSGVPDAEGLPGDVVEVGKDLADRWFASGGCVEVASADPAKSGKPKKEAEDSAAS